MIIIIMYLYLYHIQQLPYILLLCASCDLRNFNKNKQKYLKSIKPAKNTKKYKKTKIINLSIVLFWY